VCVCSQEKKGAKRYFECVIPPKDLLAKSVQDFLNGATVDDVYIPGVTTVPGIGTGATRTRPPVDEPFAVEVIKFIHSRSAVEISALQSRMERLFMLREAQPDFVLPQQQQQEQKQAPASKKPPSSASSSSSSSSSTAEIRSSRPQPPVSAPAPPKEE
jgi:hypothetical protein